MLELSPLRKNKISLADYNAEQDMQNRMLMSDFSSFDLEVLEEILFSPLKISIKKLARNLDSEEETLLPVLKKFSLGGLFSIQDDTILVDKEMRKYFEFQVTRFSPEFKPDMEFLQGLLRKVPIHILPTWYSIPRSSNNIFDSIVEKYLLTPQIYQRYLMELNFGDPSMTGIIQDLFSSPNLKLPSSDIIAKYNLTRREFEEVMLLLEFNFVCCVVYEKEDDYWTESITPFQEWREYLTFMKESRPLPLESDEIFPYRTSNFAFIEDMSALLLRMKKSPIPLSSLSEISSTLTSELALLCSLPTQTPQELTFAQTYLSHVIQKLCLIKLADLIEGKLYALETSNDWLDMTPENRALYIHRHPLNRILSYPLSAQVATERNLHEAEKAIKRALHGRWMLFDEFLKSVVVGFNEDSIVTLKKTGKHWKYALPQYGDEERLLLEATIFEWLFEAGMVKIGSCEGRKCFAVTPFGCSVYED